MKSFVGIIFLILAVIISMPVSLYSGYVGHQLWAWFIEPVTHVVISTSQMIGINIFIGYLLSGIFILLGRIESTITDGNDIAGSIATLFSNMFATTIFITTTWLAGWIWHLIIH